MERLFSVCFADTATGYVVGLNGTILKTTNGGTNWNPLSSGTNTELHSVFFCNKNVGHAVGGYGLVLSTTDAGENWTREEVGTHLEPLSVYYTDENTGYLVGVNGMILKTSNEIKPYLLVSANSITIDAAASNTNTFDITSNVDWSPESDQSWLSLSSFDGTENSTVTLNAEENISFVSRTAIITVSASDAIGQTIILTQNGTITSISDIKNTDVRMIFDPVFKRIRIEHQNGDK